MTPGMKLTADQRRKRTSDGMAKYHARRRRVAIILHGHRTHMATYDAINNANFDDLVAAVEVGVLEQWRRELVASRITSLITLWRGPQCFLKPPNSSTASPGSSFSLPACPWPATCST